MPSNLRARPIEGYITDSAGNVLRNTQITIKQVTSDNPMVVDTINADSTGYFISKPLKNGTYDIYEAGIRTVRTIHSPSNTIQCYKANISEYAGITIDQFADIPISINKFKCFIQIESNSYDVQVYGSSFPIYDRIVNTIDIDPNFAKLSDKYSLLNTSRLTTTRFDVEYYSPLTSTNTAYKRIRWAGVPGIRVGESTKLLLPLDYYSIVPSLPKYKSPSLLIPATTPDVDGVITQTFVASTEIDAILSNLTRGDIVLISTASSSYYMVIRTVTPGATPSMVMDPLVMRNFHKPPNSSITILGLYAFDGMFDSITSINEEVNERFSVVEDTAAQNSTTWLYDYP